MKTNQEEIQRRTEIAISTIKSLFGTKEGDSVTLFINHHLEELGKEYWQTKFGTEEPKPQDVLSILEFSPYWEEEDGIDSLDFTLPDNVTDYVLCVSFDDNGQVRDITMES